MSRLSCPEAWKEAWIQEVSMGQVHIRCDLQPYADLPDWPPVSQEYLVCERASDFEATVLNSPFFVDGIALGDVIAFDVEDGEPIFRGLECDNGNSTLQVVYTRMSQAEAKSIIEGLGCSAEAASRFDLLSVVVPAEVSYANVYDTLAYYADEVGSLDFREAKVSAAHLPERPPLIE